MSVIRRGRGKSRLNHAGTERTPSSILNTLSPPFSLSFLRPDSDQVKTASFKNYHTTLLQLLDRWLYGRLSQRSSNHHHHPLPQPQVTRDDDAVTFQGRALTTLPNLCQSHPPQKSPLFPPPPPPPPPPKPPRSHKQQTHPAEAFTQSRYLLAVRTPDRPVTAAPSGG